LTSTPISPHSTQQAASAKANRASLVEESAKAKVTVRDAARLDRQRKIAEVLRQKADAEDRGEDVERQKNWEWTIEENDNWEKKLARKARRADFEFHGMLVYLFVFWLLMGVFVDDAHAARRRYKKDLDVIKPDLVAYNKQKEVAMGLAPGTLVTFNPTEGSSAVRILVLPTTTISPCSIQTLKLVPTSQQQQLAAENLYRDANTLIYGDSKPSEDAIDRLVSKINQEFVFHVALGHQLVLMHDLS
jgi:pre-mRNA-splicing factor SYF2